jgi:lipopolysaccharide biosynthesis glycosyltransferase
LYFIELLKSFDRVLYIDADVMPTPHAPNIFDVFPDNAFCAFDENFGIEPMSRDEYVQPLLGRVPWWEKNERGLYRFFNAGVMLSAKSHLPAFEDWRNTPDEPSLWFPWPEQAYLNYMVNAGRLPFVDMGQEFNRMSMGQFTTQQDRVRANFIHYAGPVEYHGCADKATLIREDFEYFGRGS